MSCFTDHNLSQRVAYYASQGDAFALLQGLSQWLRQGKAKRAPQRVAQLTHLLQQDPVLCNKVATALSRWLCSVRLYPLFVSAGIFSREGFARELSERLYEKINPAYKDPADLRDVSSLLFRKETDRLWLEAVSPEAWLTLFHLLRKQANEHERELAQNYFRREGFHAIEMLSIWIAAEALEPDLVRLEPKLLDRDSPFVGLKREITPWLQAKIKNEEFDDSHLYVMLLQCRKLVSALRKKGTGAGAGSSLAVSHLLERLDQTFDRMELLLKVFAPENTPPRYLLELTGALAISTTEQNSVSWLWRRSVKMLSRSITQNTSNHGEHYITRTKKEYMNMFWSAAGGGVLIALMSLFKLYLGKQIDNHFLYGLASGLNYGIGFMIIFMLHGTVATKQPAMTASRFAAAVEKNDKGQALYAKLGQLLVDVIRSQVAAVAGNVLVAVSVAMMITLVYDWTHDFPLLNKAEVSYQLKSINPQGATLWYAAIAGVWLFCSGIISGFFDNRCDYLNVRLRLRHHPVLKALLPEKIRSWFADYMHKNYGSLMGNLCFGLLLGMTGFVGHALDVPFDIRHVAFSSANVGYASVSGSVGLWIFLKSLFFVLLIGCVNLAVSFSLTLWVALRSREAKVDSWWQIIKAAGHIVKERPSSLFLPIKLPEPDNKTKV